VNRLFLFLPKTLYVFQKYVLVWTETTECVAQFFHVVVKFRHDLFYDVLEARVCENFAQFRHVLIDAERVQPPLYRRKALARRVQRIHHLQARTHVEHPSFVAEAVVHENKKISKRIEEIVFIFLTMGVSTYVSLCVCATLEEYIDDTVKTLRETQEVREMLEEDTKTARLACLELVCVEDWWKEDGFADDSICHMLEARRGKDAMDYIKFSIFQFCWHGYDMRDMELGRLFGDQPVETDDWCLPPGNEPFENLDLVKIGDREAYVVLRNLCSHCEKIGTSCAYSLDPKDVQRAVEEYPKARLMLVVEGPE